MSTRGNRGQMGSRSVNKGTMVPLAPIVVASAVREKVAREIVRAMQGALARNEGDNGRTLKLTKKFLPSNPPEFLGEAKPLEAESWLEQITKTLDLLRVENEGLRISLAVKAAAHVEAMVSSAGRVREEATLVVNGIDDPSVVVYQMLNYEVVLGGVLSGKGISWVDARNITRMMDGIPLHGHDELEDSSSQGNFLELLMLLSYQNETLGVVLSKDVPEHLKLTTPSIRKDIVNTIAVETTNAIVRELGDGMFYIVFDKSWDASMEKQMIVSLRYVESRGYWRLEQHTFNMVIWNLTQLKKLHLDWVDISSPLPHALLTSLTSLSLGFCQLHGKFPENIFHLPNLRKLIVQYNGDLTGKFPNFNVNISLQFLDLSWTIFSGQLPDSIDNLKALKSNKFTREIPPLICGPRLLKVLNLSNNSLSGMIPQCLGNLSNGLSVLNLRMNNLHELQVLVLKFKTKSKLRFPKLRIIDISYNEFTSLLPTNYISRFEAMMNVDEHELKLKLKYMGDMYYKDYVVVIVKRHEIKYSRILTVISIIDLSSNKFIEEIPKSVGRLNSLRGLNLSHNNLKGQIPTSLGNLSNLGSLDLSSNQLVGEIPQQLTSLMFLAMLNLSYNQLVGQIPQGRQFNTF
ncbi:receptor-like protein 43 [Camellia sinensis]|uniref:receptor-like protein 43 n=1 Tax=Camellia sinensis TaxID=4442 RepID=UPI001035AF8C|nr:receptor-like protein 43 [Camellia sinensis]